jgi:hypothetical protein
VPSSSRKQPSGSHRTVEGYGRMLWRFLAPRVTASDRVTQVASLAGAIAWAAGAGTNVMMDSHLTSSICFRHGRVRVSGRTRSTIFDLIDGPLPIIDVMYRWWSMISTKRGEKHALSSQIQGLKAPHTATQEG